MPYTLGFCGIHRCIHDGGGTGHSSHGAGADPHPFREGNGRASRLLATLMALQAGLPLLDFSDFERERKEEYFAAVQRGMARNYQPMERVFSEVITRSLRNAGE